ncbi:MAG: hypothetical protein IKP96_01965 [Elusimicrobiaceae bacterium]|nr:hypothetical protein [Elusimicrobiaceae bacterium]
MQKNIGKSIFLGGLVGIVFGVVWDQLTPLPYLVFGMGIIFLFLGTIWWFTRRQENPFAAETSTSMAFAFWGISLVAFLVFFLCRYFPGVSLVSILPEHLQDSRVIKIIFFIGLGFMALSISFFIHFCWFASQSIRILGKVTSCDTCVQDGKEIYAEVISYCVRGTMHQVTGSVWTPLKPTIGRVRTVWVRQDNLDKALVYSLPIVCVFGVFFIFGLAVLGFIFYVA